MSEKLFTTFAPIACKLIEEESYYNGLTQKIKMIESSKSFKSLNLGNQFPKPAKTNGVSVEAQLGDNNT